MIRYLLSRSLYMDICLPVCGGVFRKFLKISSTYIGKFSSLCGGISLNFFKNPSTIIGNLTCLLTGCFKKFAVIFFPLLLLDTSCTKLNGLHETFFIKTKIFSLCMDNRGQKLRIFRKRKNAPHLYWKFDNRFYNVFKKKVA